MDNIRFGDSWRVTLQTADASSNAQAPDSAILAAHVRVYVNGTLSVTAATVTTLADIVGGHAISWPNTTATRGDRLRMQVAFTVDTINYEARFEALVESNPLTESTTGSWQLDSLASLLLGTYNSGQTTETAISLIKAKTDLIGTGSAQLGAPVSGDGDLLELILETDYLAANGRALEWSFDEITGITTSATGSFGIKDALTGIEVYVNTTGTVTDLGSGTFKVSFNITNTALDGLPPGKYDWSVEVLESPYKITIARNRQIKTRVDVVEKQT